MFYKTLKQLIQMQKNTINILDKSVKYAEEKKFEVNNLLESRLFPDQFNLLRQIQIISDSPKIFAARITGKEAPIHEDKETNIPELKARLNEVIKYLETYTEEDFKNCESKDITLPFLENKQINAIDYLNQFVLPNFYFHMSTAYAILRHNGLIIGKKDYIGVMNLK